MVFDGSGEVRPGIEEACNYGIVLYEDMDDCWRTEDSWGGLTTESFNGRGTYITGDDNSLLFEWLSLLLKYRLSRGVFCKELDECWQNKDSWGGLINELFNGGRTCITGDEKSLLFEWIYLQLNHRLSLGVVRCLPWFFPVPILWRLPIPFVRGIINVILVCGVVVCLLFGQQNVRANFLAWQLQSCLSFSTRNKIDYDIFVSI